MAQMATGRMKEMEGKESVDAILAGVVPVEGRNVGKDVTSLGETREEEEERHEDADIAGEIVIVAPEILNSTEKIVDNSADGRNEDLLDNVEATTKVELKPVGFPSDIRAEDIKALSNTEEKADVLFNEKLTMEHESMDCTRRRIYMYDLPAEYNIEVLHKCNRSVIDWYNFCPFAANDGLGLADTDRTAIVNKAYQSGWHKTDAYMLEVIFHSRLKKYKCLTDNAAEADAIFVPYYTGLAALPYLYQYQSLSKKGIQGEDLVAWIDQHAAREWSRYNGKDHFMILGRTTWDFELNIKNGTRLWGSGLKSLPQFSNMTIISMERDPWAKHERAVPYATSFHPSALELRQWLGRVRNAKRTSLFSFAGAKREHLDFSIRDDLVDQCLKSSVCRLVNCRELKCSHNPKPISNVFLHSKFCLQPRGDTPTRRSAFDSMIAGCIPVFFHHDSAYTQYMWYLPSESKRYSAFISESDIRNGVSIETELRKYSEDQIRSMREYIISLIPRLIYTRESDEPGFKRVEGDAFDVAIEGVLQAVKSKKEESISQ